MTIRLPLPRRRWVRVTLLVALAALVCVGVWWVRRPRQMQVVARVPGGVWAASAAGFLESDSDDESDTLVFTLRDWQHGAPQWQVRIPYVKREFPVLANASLRIETQLSPDGTNLLRYVSGNGFLLVHAWRSGQLVTSMRLPAYAGPDGMSMNYSAQVSMMDTGRLIACYPERTALRLCVIEGSRIVATGSVRYPFPLSKQTYVRTKLASDGQLLQFSYGQLSYQQRVPNSYKTVRRFMQIYRFEFVGGVIRCKPRSVGTATYGIQLLDHGVIVDLGGRAYLPDGQQTNLLPKGSTLDNVLKPNDSWIIGWGRGVKLLASPLHGEIALPAANVPSGEPAAVTPDGRYRLLEDRYIGREHCPPFIRPLVDRVDWLAGVIEAIAPERSILTVYERPWQRRAVYDTRAITPQFHSLNGCFLSPDGHALAVTGDETVLLRW
ncbi:MAG: hypothetical protein ACYDBB_25545 [Armatimonadota bacterium]